MAVSPEKQPEIQIESRKETDPRVISFDEKIKKDMKVQIDELLKIFELSSTQDEISKQELRKIRLQRTKELVDFYNKAVDKYKEAIAIGRQNLPQLEIELHKEAKQKAADHITILKAYVNKKTGKSIETDEVATIKMGLAGIDDFEKNHKDIFPIYEKITKNATLSDAEIETVAKLIQLKKIDPSQPLSFEATSAGLFIGLMKPADKYRTVQAFIKMDKSAESGALIDAFTKTGILTVYQSRDLFKEAAEKGQITKEKLVEYNKKLDSGFYDKQQEEFRQLVQKEVQKVRGRFSDNFLNRFVGKPLIGLLMAVWGSTTFVLNVLANREGPWKKIFSNWGTTIERAAGSHAIPGAIIGLAGSQIMSGTLKDQNAEYWGLTNGCFADALQSLLKSKNEQMSEAKIKAADLFSRTYLNAPKPFMEYLDEGGFETLMKLRKKVSNHEKIGNEPAKITFDHIEKTETSPALKTKLDYVKKLPAYEEPAISKKFFEIAASSETLLMTTQKDFNQFTQILKQTQKP